MPNSIRILARLDIKGEKVIKGINLEGLRVVGDPQTMACRYYDTGIDGLIYMDAVASLYNRNHLSHLVSYSAKHIFVPLTVGGGIRTLKDVEEILAAGADKIAINTAAIKNPTLITDIANRFGSQCMVLSIEAKKQKDHWEAYYDNGRERSGLDVFTWAKQAQSLGAGEILLTSIDAEGTRDGFDIALIKTINEAVTLPVIASGGYGATSHFTDLYKNTSPSAVAIADAFHYERTTPQQLKKELDRAGLPVRSR